MTLPDLDPPETALLDHAPFAPFMEARTARPPGIMPLPEGDGPLALALPDFAAQMRRRGALLDARAELCVAGLPEAAAAAAELLDAVIADAAGRDGFAFDGDTWLRPDGIRVAVDRAAPLASLGRMVAEDWCLMLPDAASGEYRLAGAVLCFPSRWLLSEKLGRPLTVIHDPVPDYDDGLARRVNRLFETIRPGRGLWRVNWLVHATCEPHLPLGLSDKLVEEAGAYPDGPLYLRTERQTLTRLPASGAVAFGIKTSLCPLEALTAEQRAGLAGALARLDARTVAYRAGSDLHHAALERLGRLAA